MDSSGVLDLTFACRAHGKLGSECQFHATSPYFGIPLFDAAAVQIGLDLKACAAAEARAIDLQVFHDPLHIVAGFGE